MDATGTSTFKAPYLEVGLSKDEAWRHKED